MKISIRSKIFWCFSLLILAVFLVMNIVINTVIQKSNEAVISKELIKEKESVEVYSKQFFLIKGVKPDENAFGLNATAFLADLEQKLDVKGEVYTVAGRRLGTDSINNMSLSAASKDLGHGFEKKLAYTITIKGDEASASITIPVIVDGSFIGLLHFTRDYTGLYRAGYYLRSILTASVFIILLIMFLASYIISNSIIKPVSSLNRMAKSMAAGEFGGEALITTNDELGELSASFNSMREQIYQNIKTIERDHMLLKELDSYRKRFFDNVAHEFKTPLTTIKGYAQVMREDGFSDREFCEKGINHIQEECERLHRMVQSLLAISRQSSGKAETLFGDVDLSELISTACEEMGIVAKSRDMGIRCDVAPDILVRGYADDLKSVFVNILDNAIKYGTEGTDIRLEGFVCGGQAEIVVTNEGKSIPPEQLEKIFEPFYRIYNGPERQVGGSGLGLSIVKAVMDKHNGTVRIESIENAYTKVFVKIPVKGLQF